MAAPGSVLNGSITELLSAVQVAPSPEPSPPRPPARLPLRVMSFNVRFGTAEDGPNRWELRRDLVVRTIRKFDPDLLGLQEALDFQCDHISAALGRDYAFHGAGREDGGERGETVGVYFRRGRFEKLDAGHFWLSETPDKPGSISWDSELTRMVSWVKLVDADARRRGADSTVLFVNTHWDHFGKKARFESARVMRRRIREVHPNGTVVIVGDFNSREDDEEYAELVRAADDEGPAYVDAYRALHPLRQAEEASFHGFKGGRDGARIDWIIHSPDLAAIEASIDHGSEEGRYPSDHYPVTAELELKR